MLYVDKRNATQPVEMFSDAGKIGPAYCTGVGKAMLAFLPKEELAEALTAQSFHQHTPATLTSAAALRTDLERIRHTGISYDREEHEPQIICVAVPILSTAGEPLSAISVTTSTLRQSLADLEAIVTGIQTVLVRRPSRIA